jgi:hypothetical protein
MFKKAVKHELKLRMAISGASGSGKTYTSLALASALAGKGRIALIDTEHGSASKYANLFDFDVLELTNFHPDNYIKAIKAAERAGYDVLIIDSMSHAWNGLGGVLELVGGVQAKWNTVARPLENNFISAIVSSKMHIIATMRAKMKTEVEKDEKGKSYTKKVGLDAIQRQDIEYEFDFACVMDSNNLTVEKTRCPDVNGLTINRPGAEFMKIIIKWLNDGKPQEDQQAPAAIVTVRDLIAELKPQLATLYNVTDDSLLKAINETGKGQAYLAAKGKPLGFGTELSPSTYDAIKTQVLDALNKKGE